MEGLLALEALSWHSIRLSLRSRRALGAGKTPALIVLNALIKSVKTDTDFAVPSGPPIKKALHLPQTYAHRFHCRSGYTFPLEILVFGADDLTVLSWLDALMAYLATHEKAGFELAAPPTWSHHTGLELLQDLCTESSPPHAELEFLSPLPFKREPGLSRTTLLAPIFFQQLRQRVLSLFDVELPMPELESIHLMPWYWEYIEMRHLSKSQPGHTQYYNGCVGSLFLTGELQPIMPWLRLAAAIHAGGSVMLNPLGYCRLHIPARSHFDHRIICGTHWHTALSKVQNTHPYWADHLRSSSEEPFDSALYCAELAAKISTPGWQPAPSLILSVPKREGHKDLEKFGLDEWVIHTGLRGMLETPIDRSLNSTEVGYKANRTLEDTIKNVNELIAQGYSHVVESCIDECYASVELSRLHDLLDDRLPPSDTLLRQLITAVLSASFMTQGSECLRRHGLAPSSPLSPVLINLYLSSFDKAFTAPDIQLVRYADQFILLARSQEQAESLLLDIRKILADIDLKLLDNHTHILPVDSGFHFLGQAFGGKTAEHPLIDSISPARKTVYITEKNCFLGHSADALEIRRDDQPVITIPLRQVADIILLTPASFSSGLIEKCLALDISLIFAFGSIHQTASLASHSRRFYAIAQAQAQHYSGLTDTERLILAKSFATRKIENYRPLIRARYHAGHAQLLKTLEAALTGIEQASNTQGIRGHEGYAARQMMAALNDFITVPEFRFAKRQRHLPDRMNALLNFGYYLLFTRLNTLVRAAGLNPYLGYLHDGDDDYESLVCDIQEVFRAPVDRLLLSLVNRRIIQPHDFRETPDGMRLQPAAIKRFIIRFEEMLHADAGDMSLLTAMEVQVDALRRYITDQYPLWLFRYKTRQDDAPAHPFEEYED